MMKRILLACLLSCVFNSGWAVTQSKSTLYPSGKKFYINAGLGDMFTRVEGDNYLGTGTGWPDDHYSVNGSSDQPYGFVGAGYTWDRASTWLPSYSFGFRFMYVSAATISGSIDQYSLPGFRNYNYTYDTSLVNLLGIYKLDLVRWHSLMPYLTLGAGVANYTTTNYRESATANVTPRVSPGFADGSGYNFTYQFGAGIDFAVRKDISINAEFNYADYGTIYTGKGANYATRTGTNYDNESLRNRLAATSVFLGLTYYPA